MCTYEQEPLREEPVIAGVPDLPAPREKKRAVTCFGWVFFLTSSGSPHVRCTPMGRTCGEPDEIELTPMCGGMAVLEAGARTHGRGHERVDRVELNGSWDAYPVNSSL